MTLIAELAADARARVRAAPGGRAWEPRQSARDITGHLAGEAMGGAAVESIGVWIGAASLAVAHCRKARASPLGSR